MTLAVGQPAPDFSLKSHDGHVIRLSDYRGKQNVVIAFFPLAWTPVWTSQIPSYQAALARFDGVQTQVLGLSVDRTDWLRAWAESLGGVTYPLLSDFYPHGYVAKLFGVFRASDGYSQWAIVVVDKRRVIQHLEILPIDEQPDNEELFKILAKLEPNRLLAKPAGRITHDQPAAAELDADLTLFCTPWCPDCRRAREYLKEHHIEFVEIDITRDRAAAQRVRGWAGGYETTPTFKIKDTIIVKFDKMRVAKELGFE